MQYYKLMYDYENDTNKGLVIINEKNLEFERYDVNGGEKLAANYISCRKEDGKTVETDYLGNNLAWFLVSERLKTLLLEFNIFNTQFIPIKNDDSNKNIGYLVNIIDKVNAMDISKSLIKKVTYHKDGKEETHNSVIKYALQEKEIGDRDLFSLDGYNIPIFISERLKNGMEKSKITGCDYQKIHVS